MEYKITYEKLRGAGRMDWDRILELQNEPFEYNEKTQGTITKEHHYSYMKQQEKNPDFFHYFFNEIVYLVVKNKQISITVPKEFRNKNLGTQAMMALLKQHPVVYATIHIKNVSSFAFFLKVSKLLGGKQ